MTTPTNFRGHPLKAKRKGGQANSSTSAISSRPTSPVLATPPGSNGSIVVSAPARASGA